MLSPDPDLHHLEKALRKLELFVVQDIFRTETAELAHVVLPTACFAEKGGTSPTRSGACSASASRRAAGAGPDGLEIIADLDPRRLPHEVRQAEEIWTEIRQVTPSYAGITYERIGRQGPAMALPQHGPPGHEVLHKDHQPGPWDLYPIDFIPPAEMPDKDYPLPHDGTRALPVPHGHDDPPGQGLQRALPREPRGDSSERCAKYGITDGRTASAAARRRRGEGVLDGTLPEGTVFMSFHFNEARVNLITNSALTRSARSRSTRSAPARSRRPEGPKAPGPGFRVQGKKRTAKTAKAGLMPAFSVSTSFPAYADRIRPAPILRS